MYSAGRDVTKYPKMSTHSKMFVCWSLPDVELYGTVLQVCVGGCGCVGVIQIAKRAKRTYISVPLPLRLLLGDQLL